ncbi:hypothetical protein [Microtetraspora sp. NBRC 16547]|uniref:hypothetical protein n=1 Tax=Microtetraspora sp. NBRC 16547 TaxID=3030993 RepID=UPI0024A09A0B|nr:hypothetical protein [Microtetraspora sp. NBRC 16547]GLW98898.1 hypothetical protein Misp02_29850 [Microtetraspora sp. NBRC 16547]
MPCSSLISPVCVIGEQVAGRLAAGAANGVLGEIAESIQDAVAWVVGNTVSWWVKIPSPDLATESAVDRIRQWTLPITAAVAVLGLISAGAKMALTRKASPLVDAGSGLVVLTATSTIGVLTASMLVSAGDSWSSWVLDSAAQGDFGKRLTAVLGMSTAAPGVVIVLGIIAILVAALQAVLMLFREAALIILAGLLPLAAAGSMTTLTKPWFRKVAGWMLALIFYKPAAAAVYATTFTMIGDGKDPRTVLMGFAMVLMSLIALPVLMKFFTWTTGSLAAAGSGGGILGASVAGAVAVGAFRTAAPAQAADANAHASFLASQLGGAKAASGAAPTPPPGDSRSTATSIPASPSATTGTTAATSAKAGGSAAAAGSTAGPAGAAAVTVVNGLATGARKAAETMGEDRRS